MQSPGDKASRIRERELYRYFQPAVNSKGPSEDPNTLSATHATSPDTSLTAWAQLCALRLNVSRSMISVIGKDTQYTLSEATKTLDLGDTSKAGEEADSLWMGCATFGSSEGLCENTVKLPVIPGKHACFTVPDLSKDRRFRDKPFVSGPPYWKFYVGTPLTTKRGVNIGSLCVLDHKPRPGLTSDQEAFLATIARTVMSHLEMHREAEDRKRGTRMSKGLNAFVEGKGWLDGQEESHNPVLGTRRPRSNSIHQDNDNKSSGGTSHMHERSGDVSTAGEHNGSGEESDRESPQRTSDAGHRSTFARAANLLRQSLDLQDKGGVVFLDTTVGFRGRDSNLLGTTSSSGEASDGYEETLGLASSRQTSGSPREYKKSTRSTFQSALQKSGGQKRANVLAFSTPAVPLCNNTGAEQEDTFNPLTEKLLQQFLQRYPRGKLWSFDEDGTFSSSEEELITLHGRRRSVVSWESRARRKLVEAKLLQYHFRGVRQLLFAPLWDAGSARWFSGCFCWSTDNRPVFSNESELSFIVAFGNSVMAEVSRLATIAADQQKGDFIGSISHELRSPLHGILASAEFLADTDCDAFQVSLVDTIDSCGRTLLDTINHVLDFSKINSFERNWRKVRKPRIDGRTTSGTPRGRASRGSNIPESAPPLLNIYAVTDVAAICEEVVEGVYAGQIYQSISSTDISDTTAGNRGKTSERGLTSSRSLLGGSGTQLVGKPIDVILDIDHGDFTFTTQPGAVRRVIMNVFGNALKYTEQGVVIVKLALHDLEGKHGSGQEQGKLLVITVTDTGKGISSQYLRTRLFTPFAQENTLAPGTGLGLSIVRSIINMLGGSIDIRSEVGQGTEVKVSLPLMRVSGTDTPVSTPSTTGSIERTLDDSISTLQAEASGMSVALYGFDTRQGSEVHSTKLGTILEQYVSGWYGLECMSSWPFPRNPNIIIVDEKDLESLLQRRQVNAPIIALCSNSSRHIQSGYPNIGTASVEYISKPFGPYKLAKALRRRLLEKTNAIGVALPSIDELAGSDNPETSSFPLGDFEAVTLEGQDENTPMFVQTNGTVTASESANAQRALDSLSDGTGGDEAEQGGSDFPFPAQAAKIPSNDLRTRGRDLLQPDPRRPKLLERKTDPGIRLLRRNSASDPAAAKSTYGKPVALTSHPASSVKAASQAISTKEDRPPRILLVDDNKINLRLLETFMNKRKYKDVDLAENGQLAVKAAEMREDGYDIIFMDISMPVMDGFEATRAIRDIEETRRCGMSLPSGNTQAAHSALIIALTGLASSRDQSEAFTSGVDLFMTKPVSFKEVGRLLDNWEANGGSENREMRFKESKV